MCRSPLKRTSSHLASSPKSFGTALAQAQVLDLAGVLQFLHLLDRGLNWLAGVDSVGIVQVDLVDSQSLQGFLDGLLDVLGLVPRLPLSRGRIDPVAKLGCEEDVLSFAGILLEPAANHVLVVAIDVCAVPEAFAGVVGVIQQSEPLGVRFGFAVVGREAHEAEAQGCHLGAILTELSGRELNHG